MSLVFPGTSTNTSSVDREQLKWRETEDRDQRCHFKPAKIDQWCPVGLSFLATTVYELINALLGGFQ